MLLHNRAIISDLYASPAITSDYQSITEKKAADNK